MTADPLEYIRRTRRELETTRLWLAGVSAVLLATWMGLAYGLMTRP